MLDWCCVAAVNNEDVLRSNLAASPCLLADPERLTVMRDQPNASLAYNRALDRTRAEICVFAHQDVYLPRAWEHQLIDAIEQVESVDPDWAVLGIYGVRPCGMHAGRVWDTGLGRELHVPFETPTPVSSLDELLIILRRSSGLRFDEAMPGFHLFGTDIVQQARREGLGAYVIEAPVVHNSVLALSLSGAFMQGYGFLARKWRDELPIKTTVTKVTRWGLKRRWRNFRRFQLASRIRRLRAVSEARPRRDPSEIARMLGYE